MAGFGKSARRVLAAFVFALPFAATADAYTTYLKPSTFMTADGGSISVEAAYAQQFFTPGVAFSSSTMHVIDPDGSRMVVQSLSVQGPATTLQAALPLDGTYRISTGESLGAITRMVAADGSWRPLAANETPPEGVETTTLQTVTLSDVYVTKGPVNRTVVDTPSGRLSIHPVTHPNQILVASGFEVELLLDGQPFPNMPFVLYASGDPDTKIDRTFVTDARGHATLTFDQPGTYVAAVRYRGPAPADSGVAVRSYTTTLTFNVMSELPPPVVRQENSRNRRSARDAFRSGR